MAQTITSPPNSLENEIGVIGSLIIDSNLYNRIQGKLNPDDFYSPTNSILFKAIKDMVEAWDKVDLLTISAKLKSIGKFEEIGGNSTLISYTSNVIVSWNIEQYARIVKEKSVRRKTINAGNNLILLASDETKDVSEVLRGWERMVKEIPSISEDTAVTMEEFFEDYNDRMEIINNWGRFGYLTWIKALDNNCDGLQPWTVTRLNAYSNHWKTRLAVWIMANLLKSWISCGFFSTEVTKTHFLPMIAGAIQWVGDHRIKDGKIEVDWDLLNSLPLKFYQDKRRIDDIISVSIKNKFKVVIIDFAQNIDAGYRGDMFKNMEEYSKRIQQFAIDNNIAVFDLSQINMEGAKVASDRVIPSKGSGALVESADVGIVLERVAHSDWTATLKFDIRKNKYWPLTSSELMVDFYTYTYTEFVDV